MEKMPGQLKIGVLRRRIRTLWTDKSRILFPRLCRYFFTYLQM